MSDIQAALHRARRVHPPGEPVPCTLCIIIEHHSGEEKAWLESAGAGKISGRALHAALRKNGLGIGRDVISNHRNEGHTP